MPHNINREKQPFAGSHGAFGVLFMQTAMDKVKIWMRVALDQKAGAAGAAGLKFVCCQCAFTKQPGRQGPRTALFSDTLRAIKKVGMTGAAAGEGASQQRDRGILVAVVMETRQ